MRLTKARERGPDMRRPRSSTNQVRVTGVIILGFVLLGSSMAFASTDQTTKPPLITSKTRAAIGALQARENAVVAQLAGFQHIGSQSALTAWEIRLKTLETAQTNAETVLSAALSVHSISPKKVTPAKVSASSTPGIGQVAKDGDFAFVVKRVSCGASAASAVSSGGFGETVPAGAQECIVTMTVTNDKTEAQTFYDSNQYAYDAKGRQLSADSSGSIYLTGDQDGNQINPGITVTAPVPFQIPAGDSIVKIVLHDSAYSGGVTVRV